MYVKLKPQPLFWFSLFFALSTPTLFSQKRGYVHTVEGDYHRGRIQFSIENPDSVKLQITKFGHRVYAATHLKSFGFLKPFSSTDSVVYESIPLPSLNGDQIVFMKRLVNGKYVLLKLIGQSNKYFLRYNEQLTELKEDDFRLLLGNLTEDTSQWRINSDKLKFRDSDLISIVENFNYSGNLRSNFTFFQVSIGYLTGNAVLANNNTNPFDLINSNLKFDNITFGISKYTPIKKSNRIGYLKQVFFERYGITEKRVVSNGERDLKLNFDRLNFQFLPTYKLSVGKPVFYMFGGPSISLTLSSASELFQSDINQNNITFSSAKDIIQVNSSNLGMNLGLGIRLNFGSNILVNFELRHQSDLINGSAFTSINSSQAILKFTL